MPGASGLSIIVPVHNEAPTVERALIKMLHATEHLDVAFEIIVCENGSLDDSLGIIERVARTDSRIRVERLSTPDYGEALQQGIRVAQYDNVVIFNVDYWSAEFLKSALAGLQTSDMVIGSKIMGTDRRPLVRRIITRTFNLFLRVFFGFRGSDTHGMKAFKRDAVSVLAAACVSKGWIFDTELVLRAERAGLRIVETPVDTMEIRPPSYVAIVRRVPETLRNLERMRRGLGRSIVEGALNPNTSDKSRRSTIGPTRWFALAAGTVCLIGWQISIFRNQGQLSAEYRLKASSGLQAQQHFVYFLYYLNLFPVTSLQGGRDMEFFYDGIRGVGALREPDRLVYTPEAARRVVAEDGKTLVMEWGHTIRFGGWLQTYLYLPDAWRRGSPQYAEMRIATSLAFVLGLVALYASASIAGFGLFGLMLVAFLGSNPFELYEVYARENVFGWPIAVFCITFSLMVPILAKPVRGWYYWAAALVSGAVLGTAYHIRVEAASPIAGVVAAFLLATGLRARRRMALAAATCLALVAAAAAWNTYFEHKWTEATAVVERAGGHPYRWPRENSHHRWGSLWAGLGDFDTKYGYAWQDDVSYAYAQPVLQQKYGQDMPWWWGVRGKTSRTPEDYFDPDGIYYRHPLQTPHLLEVLRDKVLHDAVTDPLWYLSILARRVLRVLGQTTPVQIYLTSKLRLPIPFNGYLALPILLIAIVLRDRVAMGLLVASFSLSLTAIAMYSGGNTPHYGIYHLCAVAVAVNWLVRFVAHRAAVGSPHNTASRSQE